MSIIAGKFSQRFQFLVHPLPLLDKSLLIARKGQSKHLGKNCRGGMVALAEGNAQGKFISFAEIDFAHHRNVAAFGAVKLPIHFEITMQILPAIAFADKTTGASGKTAVA